MALPVDNTQKTPAQDHLEKILGPLTKVGSSFRGTCPACQRNTLSVSGSVDNKCDFNCFYCGGVAVRRKLQELGVTNIVPFPYQVDYDKIKGVYQYWSYREQSILNSPVEKYLLSRAINVRSLHGGVLGSLRYKNFARYPFNQFVYPTMVAFATSLFDARTKSMRASTSPI
jgi:hypothetical protein